MQPKSIFLLNVKLTEKFENHCTRYNKKAKMGTCNPKLGFDSTSLPTMLITVSKHFACLLLPSKYFLNEKDLLDLKYKQSSLKINE